jgi:hypothetical protein
MWHTVFITVHAGAGLVALITGAVALRTRRLLGVYRGALVSMALALASAVAVDWAGTDPAGRVLFAAFVALAAVMVWQAFHGNIWFTLVALLDAFVVVAVLDAGAPVWLVVGAGVVIAIAGHAVGQTRVAIQRSGS